LFKDKLNRERRIQNRYLLDQLELSEHRHPKNQGGKPKI
jgi:hypothetical protein